MRDKIPKSQSMDFGKTAHFWLNALNLVITQQPSIPTPAVGDEYEVMKVYVPETNERYDNLDVLAILLP